MTTPVIKPIRDPDFISVMFATRGRPHFVAELLDSLEATTADKSRLDVWIYADAIDEATLEFVRGEAVKRYSFPVQAYCGPRTMTNGEMFNRLREHNTSDPGLYMLLSDKVTFTTPGWDRIVRQAYDQFPDRLLFAFPSDNINQGSFGAFLFMSAEWANANGRLFTQHFPYWYDDTWVNQVGMLLGRILPLPVGLNVKFGLTFRMQNLLFWERFFNCLLDDRIAEADRLRELIRERGGEEAYAISLQARDQVQERLRSFSRVSPQRHQQLITLERHGSGILRSSTPRSAPGSDYRQVEDTAIATLLGRTVNLIAHGRKTELDDLLDALAHSSQAADTLIARARASIAAGDHATTKQVLNDMAQRFPDFPELYLLTADFSLALGQRAEALDALKSGSQVFPGDPTFPKRLGVIHYEAGDPEAARAAFRQALDLDPQDADAAVSLGYMALTDGDVETARSMFGGVADEDARQGLAALG